MDENRAYAALVTPRFWCARVTPIHVSGVDVPAMLLVRHGCGIHVVWFGTGGSGVTDVRFAYPAWALRQQAERHCPLGLSFDGSAEASRDPRQLTQPLRGTRS